MVVIRYTLLLTVSFETPLIRITEYMNEIKDRLSDLDQQDSLEGLDKYPTSLEIKSLFEVIIKLITDAKY